MPESGKPHRSKKITGGLKWPYSCTIAVDSYSEHDRAALMACGVTVFLVNPVDRELVLEVDAFDKDEVIAKITAAIGSPKIVAGPFDERYNYADESSTEYF